ncbi:unnamed protein product [Pleuronectes platessa]|uniref:Uncharacterized protein n=1 Tax=Pleuronectes platessa TaxID=8262 RepID=A0A9N7YKT0_PLEPL|nr:unnamed protein product [Pleuronectes platessa]
MADVREHTGGVQVRERTVTRGKAVEAAVDSWTLGLQSGSTESGSRSFSCFSGIGVVGPFCGEPLVKWAIIPFGESDDDFWQNAAAARCQTIRAVAISSHGRYPTPNTPSTQHPTPPPATLTPRPADTAVPIATGYRNEVEEEKCAKDYGGIFAAAAACAWI